MTADIHRIAKWFWDRSTNKDNPARDDGFADGAPIFLVFNPKTWKAVQPQKVTGVFGVRDVSGESFDLLDARELDYKLMTEDFFSTLKNPAVYGKGGSLQPKARHASSNPTVAFPLKISENSRHLVDQKGVPFLYTADAGWMLFYGPTLKPNGSIPPMESTSKPPGRHSRIPAAVNSRLPRNTEAVTVISLLSWR